VRQIAYYGKGGIGKSTLAANISAALADDGLNVMHIGCDPKHDSTRTLVNGRWLPTVLDTYRSKGNHIELEDVLFTGYKGVICIETGGPEPGIGCAGRGIIRAIELMETLHAFEQYHPDVVIYDVLGDVVCGGFAMPLRSGYARETYIVTSGELMALYAANNICKGINRFAVRSNIRLGGFICNARNVDNEQKNVEAFAQSLSSHLVAYIPRNELFRECEFNGKTVIEGAPDSQLAKALRALKDTIIHNKQLTIPTPLSLEDLENMAVQWYQTSLGKRRR
jgi:nitrogenase iron protein NifH